MCLTLCCSLTRHRLLCPFCFLDGNSISALNAGVLQGFCVLKPHELWGYYHLFTCTTNPMSASSICSLTTLVSANSCKL